MGGGYEDNDVLANYGNDSTIQFIQKYIDKQRDIDNNRMNNMFLIINGCTVLFMQCGFALLEAGAVRAKNVTNILLKNFLDALVGMVVYWAFGFAFAFGQVVDHGVNDTLSYSSANSFIGHTHFFLTGGSEGHHANVPGYPPRVIHYGSFFGEFFFNFVFAATATTITSGSVVERSQLAAYLIYSFFLTGFIQPVTVHWTWSNGFLLYPPESLRLPPDVYFRDYAGGSNVHAVGGLAALIACIFIGPRIGRFDSTTHKKYHIPGHSTPLTALGGFILITGFLGMVLGHSDNIELSAVNIVLGGAASGLTAMTIKWVTPRIKFLYRNTVRNIKMRNGLRKKCIRECNRVSAKQCWSFLVLVDSTLCGMVALCSGCNIIHTYSAFCIGVVAGFVYLGVDELLVWYKIDDPLGSVSTHLGGGLLGVILTPFFMVKEYSGLDGIFYWKGCVDPDDPTDDFAYGVEGWEDGDCMYSPFYQLGWTLFGVLIICFWTAGFSAILFGMLWHFNLLRIDEDTEIRGNDIPLHGEPAYPNASYGHGWDNEGEFALQMMSSQERNGHGTMRRDVRMLINPYKKETAGTSDGTLTRGGIIEMVLSRQQNDIKNIQNALCEKIQKISEVEINEQNTNDAFEDDSQSSSDSETSGFASSESPESRDSESVSEQSSPSKERNSPNSAPHSSNQSPV